MRTQAAVASKKTANETVAAEDERVEEISALSSQVSSAFGELSRVKEELAERIERFREREADLEEQCAALEKDRDEHEARVARAERIARQADAREEALCNREEAVGRREQAAASFRELLSRMAVALEDPTPTKMSEALDAATVSLRESHAALGAAAAAVDAGSEEPVEAEAWDAGSDASVDLSDLTEEERHKLSLLQKLGTASPAEIAEQIRSERGGSGQKKSGWFS